MPDQSSSHPLLSGHHPGVPDRKRVDVGQAAAPGEASQGERIGRFVTVCDVNGQRHAVAAGAVSALCETDDGTLLLLPGGRMIHVVQPMRTVMRWLSS